jgi:7 transmembrane helices usually fused to an inactive transglutaminase
MTTLIDSQQLMAALAIGAAVTVAARSLLGVRTVGVFAPALLAITVIQLGPRDGVLVLATGVSAGLVALPLVTQLALPRVARLGLVLCAICLGISVVAPVAEGQAVLPVVVLAVIVERGWDVMAGDGWRASARLLISTALLAMAVVVVFASPPVRSLVARGDLTPIAVGAIAILLAGSYRGLRLGERRRFRQLLVSARGA